MTTYMSSYLLSQSLCHLSQASFPPKSPALFVLSQCVCHVFLFSHTIQVYLKYVYLCILFLLTLSNKQCV